MKRKLFLLLAFLLTVAAKAYVAKIDGIRYNLNTDIKNAMVIESDKESPYSGDIVIPESVIYEGVTYSVNSIGHEAFEGCSRLTSVTIPNSVTSIDWEAFRDCSSLTSVTIPNSVTSIGSSAFRDCSGLTSVTIPNSVTSIDSEAFYGTAWYNNQPDGLVYAGKVAYCYKGEMRANTEITINDGTISISAYAFKGCSGLTSVTIPESVISIGSAAFSGCSSLTSVTIPNGVTSIGAYAFYSCSGLTSINYLCSPTSVGEYIFFGCNNIQVVTFDCEQVTSLFSSKTSITKITMTDKVTSIGDGAFQGCSGLTSVTIGNNVTVIGNYAFNGCSSLTSLTIPNSVTSITNGVFGGCSGLTSVTIPNSVTSIGSSAFEGCSGLTSITIGNSVNSIGSAAFGRCSGLKDFYCYAEDMPVIENVYGNNNAFRDAFYQTNIYKVTLHVPAVSVETYQATEPWKNFKRIIAIGDTSVNIEFADEKVKSLCVANWDTDNNGELSYDEADAITTLGTIFRWDKEITSFNELKYFTSLDYIGTSAFEGCSNLTSIIIPINVTHIYNSAFYECSGLTSIILQNKVKYIHERAFRYCSSLSSVTIPNNVETIEKEAFRDCSNLTSITIPNSVTSIGARAFLYTAWYNDQPDGLIYTGKIVYDYKGTMPANTSITIDEGTQGIADYAFADCDGLITINLPKSINRIGEGAFIRCSGLKSIDIPDGVTYIDTETFAHCSSLSSVTLPDGLSYIGYSAFVDCECLTSVDIPNSVTNIDDGAFGFCKNLTSLVLPNEIYDVNRVLCSGCTNLESVVLGKNTCAMGENAFHDCPNLKVVTILNPVPPSEFISIIFGGNTTSELPVFDKYDAILQVPIGSKSAYQNAKMWQNFTNIIEIDTQSMGINNVIEDERKNARIYDINGIRLKKAKKGLNIIGGKKVVIK